MVEDCSYELHRPRYWLKSEYLNQVCETIDLLECESFEDAIE